MALNDIFRVTAQFLMPESTIAQWVWHLQQTTAGGSLNQQLLDAIEANLATAFLNIDQHIDPGVIGDTLELALYNAVSGEFDTILSNAIGTIAGNGTAEMLPHQEAAVVKFFTSVGRSLGKKFIFGLDESTQDNSILLASVVSDLALFAADFDDTIVAGGNNYSAGNFNLLSEVFRPWTQTVQANVTLGTQDRRRPGIGI